MSHQKKHLRQIVFMAIAKLAVGIACNIGSYIIAPISSNAQLIPDDTLGTESTVVTPENSEQFLIEGGAVRDSNLFHSFSEFNINSGQQINFANPDSIANILTRVTGNNASNIFGTLGINGNANLFLINPNGIIFGEGANIDINGSFFASTADSINFADGITFDAVNPQDAPLLTVNIPVGVQLGNNPTSIQGQQANINAQDASLIGGDINLEQTIINAPGGEVKLSSLAEAGVIDFNADFPVDIARGDINISDRSRINVMGTGEGSITIDANNLTINDESQLEAGIDEGLGTLDTVADDIKINTTGDLSLSLNSSISQRLKPSSQGDGGKIIIATDNLILRDRSKIQTETESGSNAGDIIIDARQQVNLSSLLPDESVENPRDLALKTLILSQTERMTTGNSGNIYLNTPRTNISLNAEIGTTTRGEGDGGNFDLTTNTLSIKDGANVSATTSGSGNGGNIKIGSDLIELISENGQPTRIDSVARSGGTGDGGNIEIETENLTVRGGIITADTMSDGDGGNISIIASDRIELSKPDRRFFSGIFTASRREATGDGGNISIATSNLLVQPGIKIDASTDTLGNGGNIEIQATESIEIQGNDLDLFSAIYTQTNRMSSGNGGDVSIQTSKLRVLGGSQISAATLGSGEGGTVSIVSDSTELSGNIPFQTEVVSSVIPVVDLSAGKIRSGIYASSPGLGNANALSIETDNLSLDNGAQISVSSQQQGAAGNLSIDADNINLANSILSAETIEGDNANIILNTSNLQLRDRSLITTNATQTATGGNINIDTDILLALDNSDITANATNNFGGQVSINAQGIFGAEVRKFPTPQSDITATSRLGTEFSGTVELYLSNEDPTKGLIKLPENFVDASAQITSSCNLEKDNNFVVTGKGGLASSPQSFLRSQTILQDWRLSVDSEQSQPKTIGTIKNEQPLIQQQPEILEAQTWIINENNKVQLVANGSSGDRHLELYNTSCSS